MSKEKLNKQGNESPFYEHSEAKSPNRPDIELEPAFPKNKRKSRKTYHYDSSLSPALDWDNNSAREEAESLIAQILKAETIEEAKAAASKLKAMSKPFLNWAGKAERLSFQVPSLPLFIHERLSTKAIIQTLKGHKKGSEQLSLNLFGDTQHSIVDQTLKAYEYQDNWVNRMILGDSLVVMNSLLEYESLGGKVQMIYMDPPYGVKFGSNFQPFVRKRDVKHNEDEDMTREPEMVKAYRDTWDLGLHSYLSYLKDRLKLARELLAESGSIFVQIGDENLHHVRELMDEVFGGENFCAQIFFKKTGYANCELLPTTTDIIIWYAKNQKQVKYRQIYSIKRVGVGIGDRYNQLELPEGISRPLTTEEVQRPQLIPHNCKIWMPSPLTSSGFSLNTSVPYVFEGKTYNPGKSQHWKTTLQGLERLRAANRIVSSKNTLNFKRYINDFPAVALTNIWDDTMGAADGAKSYVVQTPSKVIERCILMTTDPGDLVLDPTCGSSTTAYVAEQWGRRWITIDVSRVPLALARQRLLTATFPYYELKNEVRGPVGGFVYKRKQNKKGEEIGGIVPHITLKSIANNEQPEEEILVDRPEVVKGITRVTGPFTVEATIPTTFDMEKENGEVVSNYQNFTDRMLEFLRQSPVLRLEGNRTIKFEKIRKPAKSLSLSAEGMVNNKPVAFVFGPENGQVFQSTVYEAAKEALAKEYAYLYVIGFAIHPHAHSFTENCEKIVGIGASYVQATPDLLMGDLLKNMRSSQIFSICGLPDISIHPVNGKYQVELLGMDVFDPVTGEVYHRKANDVPAWFIDTDYNGLCFHACQAFFPKTKAWDNLKKSLKGTFEDSIWEHLAGTKSTPFEAGEHCKIAVKVIDERGNKLLVVKELE